jgi:tetratricopeptide (TPR) repeat protein
MSDDLAIEARFTLHLRVGRGGSGDVFRATDRETGATVAVKRMLPAGEEPTALDRFRREVRLLSQITDPHVVRYVAHGADAAGTECLVVEWLEGEDLAHRQRRQRLTAAEALDVVRQAATGLHALHQAGIVHRDVKPANLFLTTGEGGALRVKVIDLGIARAAGEATLTTIGVTLGTPYYMSPEQARGEERVSHRADVFSLGVVLFELLAGRRPFTGNDFFAVLAKIVLQDPPRLADALPGVPAAIDALVGRAMSKAPEERFASARELADALAAIPPWTLEALPGSAPAAGREGAPPTVTGTDGPASQGATPASGMGLGGTTTRVKAALSVTGERRVVTAVFAGFGATAPESDLAAFEAIAAEHGASSYPTLGRRRIAVFGGAHTTGDEGVRAALAALEAAARLPGVRLAIATGRALAGATGLSGDLIERGARPVVEKAGDLAIQVDDATARLLSAHFVVERRAQTGAGHVLTGLRPAPVGPRTLVGRPIPCVGRDREIAGLWALYEECVSEPVARVAVVSGPAGIGKSRVRDELLARLSRADPAPEILLSRGSPLAESSAFGLLAPAIRRLAGILDGEPAADQRAKLAARIGRRAPTAVRWVGELCGVPGEGAQAPRDAMLTFDLMQAAWIEWLEAECAAQPVVLVIEDLHWGDRPSVRFVDAALRALQDRPFLVVALARPEVTARFPGLFAERGAQDVRLGPLTPKASERLVRAALGASADAATVQRIVARAEGNAFYIEELVRAVESGAGEAVPDTVLGMVQARLDALGAEPKRILRAASVFGQTFWRGGVAALLGEAPETLTEPLDRLAVMEVAARRSAASFPGEAEYTFRHAVVREAAYAMLSDADRRVGHRLAGAYLERVGEADPAVLGQHFELGDEPAAAARHHQRAAEKALGGNDFAAALDHAERAVALGAEGELRGRARLVQAEAQRWRGELGPAALCGAEAADLLPRGEVAWFHAVRETIAANGRLGHFDLVLLWAEEALGAEAAAGAAGAKLAALAPAAGQTMYSGNGEAAARILAEIDRISEGAGAIDPTVTARIHVVRAFQADLAGDAELALAQHQAALRGYESGGDRRAACTTLCNIGFAHGAMGAYAEAEEALRRAHASAVRMSLGTIVPLALHNLGGVLHWLGRVDEARTVETEAVLAFERAKDPRLEGASRIYLSRILVTAGDLAGAASEARRTAEAPASPPPLRAGALAALAQALLLAGGVPEALAAASEAHKTLAALGSIEDFEPLIRLVHAETLFASGDHDAARAAIVDARGRILTRASRLGEPARARFLEAVPDNARCLSLAEAWGALPAA